MYNGINRNVTGIHHLLTRERTAEILRRTRKTDKQDAAAWRDYLVYLGTYPCKRTLTHAAWVKRITNINRAFLRRYELERSK